MLGTIIASVHVFVCILLILVVLLQQGKGADMGATFGGGSNSLFGAGGADSLLTRVTTGLAALFMIGSIYLARPGSLDATADPSVFSGMTKSEPKVVPTTETTNSQPAEGAAPSSAATATSETPGKSAVTESSSPANPTELPNTTTNAPSTDSANTDATVPAAPVESAPASPPSP